MKNGKSSHSEEIDGKPTTPEEALQVLKEHSSRTSAKKVLREAQEACPTFFEPSSKGKEQTSVNTAELIEDIYNHDQKKATDTTGEPEASRGGW